MRKDELEEALCLQSGDQKQPARLVGVGDSSNIPAGSSVGERLACHGVVPGSIPGLAYSFLLQD